MQGLVVFGSDKNAFLLTHGQFSAFVSTRHMIVPSVPQHERPPLPRISMPHDGEVGRAGVCLHRRDIQIATIDKQPMHSPDITANCEAVQDKKITSFQPAWLIRCSTPH